MAYAQKYSTPSVKKTSGIKMRDISPLKRRMDTPESRAFWDNINRTSKEIAKWPEWKKPKYPDPVPRYELGSEKVLVKHKGLRDKINSLLNKYRKLTDQASEIWNKQNILMKQMQGKCAHDLVLERKTSYRDEYDSWHDGYPERKCIDCFLVETEDRDGFKKLAKSTIIELIIHKEDKIFSLEFEDVNP
jgi:hypothetical protein